MSITATASNPVTNEQFWEGMRAQASVSTIEQGYDIWRFPWGTCDRFDLSVVHCTARDGWRELKTARTSSSFAIWLHDERRHIVMLAEGDLIVTECPDAELFCAELESMRAFYG